MRAFAAGMTGTAGGVEYRIVAGKKQSRRQGEIDLRVDLRAPIWVPVGMPLLFFLTDALCDNEDVLFPPEQGYRGGDELLNFIDGARRLGWEAATAHLEEVRARARARRERNAAYG